MGCCSWLEMPQLRRSEESPLATSCRNSRSMFRPSGKGMGRRRTHLKREQPLPPGLYRHGRQYRARRGPSESWTYFGPDYVAAMASFAAWRRDGPTVDTIAWLLDLFAGTICAGDRKSTRLNSSH